MSDSQNNDKVSEDLTGRNRLAWNTVTGWGSYLVFVVAGFIMPRLMDQQVGQFTLGIWDFCWSLVNYISLTNIGIGASINRYVAKYRMVGDFDALNKTVSSVVFLQIMVAALVAAVTGLLVISIPYFFAGKLGNEVQTTQWVLGMLGLSVAAEMCADPARGILGGCHRWDIHNGLSAASRAISVAIMLTALLLGGGLICLAAIYLLAVVMTEFLRFRFAIAVCPELEIKRKYAEFKYGMNMVKFGGKSFFLSMPKLFVLQTTSILLVANLGPTALAILARPTALVKHVQVFVHKYAFMLIPTVGALQGADKDNEVREFFINSGRTCMALTLPMLIYLLVYGDVIMNLWMGEAYENWAVITTLAAGYILIVSQSSAHYILVGLNRHGGYAAWSLGITILAYLIGWYQIEQTGWSIELAAMLMVIPLGIGNGILAPIFACRAIGVPLGSYLLEICVRPVMVGLIYVAILLLCKWEYPEKNLVSFLISSGVSMIILPVMYWFWLLPKKYKSILLGKIGLVYKA